MFPTADEIRAHAAEKLQRMLSHGHDHGEIELSFPKYFTRLVVVVRQGKLEYARVTGHPNGIFPNINLKT